MQGRRADHSGVDTTIDRPAARRLAGVWDDAIAGWPEVAGPRPVAEEPPFTHQASGVRWPRITGMAAFLGASVLVAWGAGRTPSGRPEHGAVIRGSLPGAGALARRDPTGDVPMKFQAATVIAGAAMAAGANAQQAVQWRTEHGGNGHWYAVRTAGFPRTWNDCRVTALHAGGHLATLTSAGEHAFVLAQAQATAGAWSGGFGPVLGGYQPVPNGGPAANWTWVTGESWAFEKWIDGEPNDHAECGPGGDERFLAFLVDGWNDVQDVRECFGAWLVPSFVIEWSADCNNDGIVDYGQCRDGSLPDYDGDNVPDCCEQGVNCGDGSAGIVTIWGGNGWGERNIPGDLGSVTQVAAGNDHVVALRPDGSVRAWGRNTSGQSNVPPGLVGAVQVEGGSEHSVALLASGAVRCWGGNTYGESTVPAGLEAAVQVDAGGFFTVVLGIDGAVVAWGINNLGQTNVPGNLGAVARIATGDRHTMALRGDGTVRCWGDNSFAGQCNVPPTLAGVAKIAAGSFHSMALRADGTLTCWGAVSSVPEGVIGVRDIAGGGGHAIALLTDGSVQAWGRCSEQQCAAPPSLRCVESIAGGSYVTIGVSNARCCFADLNSDGYVQGADLGLVLAAWGAAPAGTAADINRDGAVDGNDLGLLLAAWGACGG